MKSGVGGNVAIFTQHCPAGTSVPVLWGQVGGPSRFPSGQWNLLLEESGQRKQTAATDVGHYAIQKPNNKKTGTADFNNLLNLIQCLQTLAF